MISTEEMVKLLNGRSILHGLPMVA